jgi:4'-phosphopantetheinyl transferase
MGIFLKKSIPENGEVGIWKIEEEEPFFINQLSLSDEERQQLDKKHQKLKIEWLASRHLVKEMTNGQLCLKDSLGKPYLPNSPLQLSISHSGQFAAVVTHQQSVGIDIQKISPKIQKIAHKFVRLEEQPSLEETYFLEHLHVIWGAKEALYKAYGKKELDFKKHLALQPFQYQANGGQTEGVIRKDDYCEKFDVVYEKLEDYILVYVVNPKILEH